MIRYLDLKLEGKTEEDYKNFFLSYVSFRFNRTQVYLGSDLWR